MTYVKRHVPATGWHVVTTIIGLPEQNHRSFESVLLLLSRVSRVRLCDRVGSSPPGSSAHGISQAGVLEWAAIAFSLESVSPLK